MYLPMNFRRAKPRNMTVGHLAECQSHFQEHKNPRYDFLIHLKQPWSYQHNDPLKETNHLSDRSLFFVLKSAFATKFAFFTEVCLLRISNRVQFDAGGHSRIASGVKQRSGRLDARVSLNCSPSARPLMACRCPPPPPNFRGFPASDNSYDPSKRGELPRDSTEAI
jgi:hypothetical protein